MCLVNTLASPTAQATLGRTVEEHQRLESFGNAIILRPKWATLPRSIALTCLDGVAHAHRGRPCHLVRLLPLLVARGVRALAEGPGRVPCSTTTKGISLWQNGSGSAREGTVSLSYLPAVRRGRSGPCRRVGWTARRPAAGAAASASAASSARLQSTDSGGHIGDGFEGGEWKGLPKSQEPVVLLAQP